MDSTTCRSFGPVAEAGSRGPEGHSAVATRLEIKAQSLYNHQHTPLLRMGGGQLASAVAGPPQGAVGRRRQQTAQVPNKHISTDMILQSRSNLSSSWLREGEIRVPDPHLFRVAEHSRGRAANDVVQRGACGSCRRVRSHNMVWLCLLRGCACL